MTPTPNKVEAPEEVCLRERYAEDRDVCGCRKCQPDHPRHSRTPDERIAGLVSALEQFPEPANFAETIADYLKRLNEWRQNVRRPALATWETDRG